MALEKREKTMLKALVGVAIISGIILYRNHRPSSPVIVPQVTKDKAAEKTASVPASSAQRSSGGGRSGGGTAGGGGIKNSGVTASDFQKHNNLNSCWVLIDGEVTDITGFINDFPSQAVLIDQYCGTFGFEAGFLDGNPQFTESIMNKSQNMGVIK